MSITLDKKNGRAIFFFKMQGRNTRANLCKKYFYTATIKNDNESVAMKNILCEANGTNNSIKIIKVRRSLIEDLLNCATTLLFFYIYYIEGVTCYTKQDS